MEMIITQKKEKTFSLCVFGRNVWSSYIEKGFGWFRIFGGGLKWKNLNNHYLMFSERYGYQKGLNIGHWRIGILK